MDTYETVSEAVRDLQRRGFRIDFNLQDNCLVCHTDTFAAEDFDILECYRFGGTSDPADETIVYGVEAGNGQKGIVVNGQGIYASGRVSDIENKLRFHLEI